MKSNAIQDKPKSVCVHCPRAGHMRQRLRRYVFPCSGRGGTGLSSIVPLSFLSEPCSGFSRNKKAISGLHRIHLQTWPRVAFCINPESGRIYSKIQPNTSSRSRTHPTQVATFGRLFLCCRRPSKVTSPCQRLCLTFCSMCFQNVYM